MEGGQRKHLKQSHGLFYEAQNSQEEDDILNQEHNSQEIENFLSQQNLFQLEEESLRLPNRQVQKSNQNTQKSRQINQPQMQTSASKQQRKIIQNQPINYDYNEEESDHSSNMTNESVSSVDLEEVQQNQNENSDHIKGYSQNNSQSFNSQGNVISNSCQSPSREGSKIQSKTNSQLIIEEDSNEDLAYQQNNIQFVKDYYSQKRTKEMESQYDMTSAGNNMTQLQQTTNSDQHTFRNQQKTQQNVFLQKGNSGTYEEILKQKDSQGSNELNKEMDFSGDNNYECQNSLKIKEFEKSLLIKFEEFNGDNNSQQDSENNRGQIVSSRASDRIYERNETSPRFKNTQSQEQLEENVDLLGQLQNREPNLIQDTNLSQNNNLNLFVIAEEDYSQYGSSHIESFYFQNQQKSMIEHQVLSNKSSGIRQQYLDQSKTFSSQGRGEPNMQYTSQIQQSQFQQQQFNKSKSTPLEYNLQKRPPILTNKNILYTDQNDRQTSLILRTSDSIQSPKQLRKQASQTDIVGSVVYQQINDSNLSQYFQRQNLVSQGTPNNDYRENMVSEDDLLSNIDRISRLLPNNDNIDKNDMTDLEHIRIQVVQLNYLMQVKENQIDLFKSKNEDLEAEVKILRQQVTIKSKNRANFGVNCKIQTLQNDATTQTNKIRPKDSVKKSPQVRVHSGRASAHSTDTNLIYETPSLALKSKQVSGHKSPSTSQTQSYIFNQQNNNSFGMDELNKFKNQLQKLRLQITLLEDENINSMQKIDRYEKELSDQESRYYREKNEIIKIYEFKLKGYEQLKEELKCMHGILAENRDYKSQIDYLVLKHSPERKIERKLSAINLIENRNMYSQTDPIKFDTLDDNDMISSTITTMKQIDDISMQKKKQTDLTMLLERAKDYEIISQQLQNEILNHRKMLKDSQDRMNKNVQEYKDQKARIKRRDHKINRLKEQLKLMIKDNGELQGKCEEIQEKLNSQKVKYDSKLQDKEFKIITLKNQLKSQVMLGSGVNMGYATAGINTYMTPISTTSQNRNLSNNIQNNGMIQRAVGRQEIVSPEQVYQMVNEIVKKELKKSSKYSHKRELSSDQAMESNNNDQQNPLYSQKMQMNKRAKSQDKPFNQIKNKSTGYQNRKDQVNYDQLQQQALMMNFNQGTQQLEEQPSFSNVSVGNVLSSPSNFNVSSTQPLKQIFNSSLKRIAQELESIRDIGQSRQASLNKRNNISTMQRLVDDQHLYQQMQMKHNLDLQNKIGIDSASNMKFGGNITYEDSLIDRKSNMGNTQILDKSDFSSSQLSHQLEQRIEELRSKRIHQMKDNFVEKRTEKAPIMRVANKQNVFNQDISNKESSYSTFQRQQDGVSNAPQSNFQNLFTYQQYHPLVAENNKEQNESIFYDLKPQFDTSSFLSNSQLTYQQKQFNQQQNQQLPSQQQISQHAYKRYLQKSSTPLAQRKFQSNNKYYRNNDISKVIEMSSNTMEITDELQLANNENGSGTNEEQPQMVVNPSKRRLKSFVQASSKYNPNSLQQFGSVSESLLQNEYTKQKNKLIEIQQDQQRIHTEQEANDNEIDQNDQEECNDVAQETEDNYNQERMRADEIQSKLNNYKKSSQKLHNPAASQSVHIQQKIFMSQEPSSIAQHQNTRSEGQGPSTNERPKERHESNPSVQSFKGSQSGYSNGSNQRLDELRKKYGSRTNSQITGSQQN